MARRESSNDNALVAIQQELLEEAQEVKQTEKATGGQYLSTKSGKLAWSGVTIKSNEVEVVVLASIFENVFYEAGYDPDTPKSPSCYAYGTTDEGMRPHPEASSPQSETCKDCPQNQWGSSERGKGKACKNVRRLSLIGADELESEVRPIPVYFKVPVTSTKNWAKYARDVADTVRRPPWAVVTSISLEPDPKTQFKVLFRLVEEVPAENLPKLKEWKTAAAEEITFPYSANKDEEEAPTPAKSRRSRKY